MTPRLQCRGGPKLNLYRWWPRLSEAYAVPSHEEKMHVRVMTAIARRSLEALAERNYASTYQGNLRQRRFHRHHRQGVWDFADLQGELEVDL